MIDLIKQNWEILIGTFGTIGAYFGGRKLKVAEEKKATSDALTSMQSTYDTFVVDLKERYTELKEEQKYIKEELSFYKTQIRDLQDQNKELLKELKLWESKYNKLKREFDAYKQKNNGL